MSSSLPQSRQDEQASLQNRLVMCGVRQYLGRSVNLALSKCYNSWVDIFCCLIVFRYRLGDLTRVLAVYYPRSALFLVFIENVDDLWSQCHG